ncbi:tetratricopeptide repeat-containing sensor histidine kinase [Flavobacterium terrae]|uniref:histidine kinase n=1 Tax=Flavobacterium terrae TaxID=415425 RepID=A0A1M6ALF3_9FLAO|nr:tetratricopeptide repeat protein [Flavobacterium terrae]SHI37339.1 Tetratricopeptide repeat-containing protein [Flavobacterium terrae]
MKIRHFLTFLILLSFSVYSQDPKIESLRKLSIDSLKKLAKERAKLPTDTILVDIYSVLSGKNLYKDNIESKKYATIAYKLASKIKDEDGMASGRNDLALIELSNGNANKAYEMLKTNLKYYSSVNNFFDLGTNYLNIGVVHGSQAQYQKAIENIEKAIFYYKKSKAPNTRLAGCYGMLGNAYSCIPDMEKSIKNYLKADKLETEINDKISILNNIGKAYSDFKKYDLSIQYYQKALLVNDKIKSPYHYMNTMLYIGELYLKLSNPKKAISYLEKGKYYAEKENHLENKILINRNLSEAYSILGDYKSSLIYLKKYTELKDTLNKKSNTAAVKEIEAKFELERQDAKLTLLENQKKLNEADLKKSKIVMVLGATVLLLFIILSWYWYKRHKIKTLLNLQQKEQFKTELKLKEVESTLEGQLAERKRLAQELHDGLGANLAGIKLSVINHFNKLGDKNESLIKDLDGVCNDVRLMSHNLIPPEFSKDTFEQIIKRLIQNYASQTQTKLHLNIDGSKDLEKMTIHQKTLLYRILQEIVTNAFKHANCSSISLLVTAFNDYINIIVEDNGIGFDTTKQFEGIGLKNIRERIKDLNSYLTIDSSPGRGTVLQFDIPI